MSTPERSVWIFIGDRAHRQWINHYAGEIEFGTYAGEWMKDRVLKTRTRELYDGLLRNHLLPTFGPVPVNRITLRYPSLAQGTARCRAAGSASVRPGHRRQGIPAAPRHHGDRRR
jgi:hypothetical protein